MKFRPWFWALFAVICVQISTWPPLHGFATDQWLLLLCEIAAAGMLIGRPRGPGLSITLAVGAITWRFWSILVPWAWGLSDLLHLAGSSIAKAFLPFAGIAPEGLRFGETLVAADPSKTLAFPLLLFWLFLLADRLQDEGPISTLRRSVSSGALLFLFAAGRWPLWAAFLATVHPDLVSNGWQVFWGAGLVVNLALAPLVLSPFFGASDSGGDQPGESPGVAGGSSVPGATGIEFRLWLITLILAVAALPASNGLIGSARRSLAIDTTHSAWEPLPPMPVDEKTDQMLAENNYAPWLKALSLAAPVTVISSDSAFVRQAGRPDLACPWKGISRFLSDASSTPDLLIEKCPTEPYSASETAAIMEWVASGGMLLAIGEHTDVFFINSHLNSLLASTGVELRADGICDHKGRWLVTGGPLHAPLPWAPRAGPWMWATGASIRGSLTQLPLAVSSPDAFSDRWQPTNRNFFGNLSPDLSHAYGPFVLSTCIQYGNGLVLVHGDSTNFNAEMLSSPGKLGWSERIVRTCLIDPQIALALFLIELILAAVSLLAIGSCKRVGRDTLGAIVALILSFWCLGNLWFALTSLPSDMTLTSRPRIAIDASSSPGIGVSYGHQQSVTAPDSLAPTLVRLQNAGLGLFTVTGPLLKVIQPNVDGILIAEPLLACDAETLTALRTWVSSGGHLFLFARRQLGGPARSIALALGLAETRNEAEQTRFPNIISRSCSTPLNTAEIPAVRHRCGKGTITIFEQWETASTATDSAIAAATTIERSFLSTPQ